MVVDRRRDPNADTGLFELVYKQNLPRVPPYLGMNLSVRGRKIFKSRNKSKYVPREKYNEFDFINSLINRKDCIKSDLKRVATAPPVILPKIPTPPRLYNGPVIEDLIDDLNKSVKSQEGTTKFPTSPLKSRNEVAATKKTEKKKSANQNKRERVSKKRELNRGNNKTNSVHRRRNAKENRKCDSVEQESRNLGLFSAWACMNMKSSVADFNGNLMGKHDPLWERETVSILKGQNVLDSAQSGEFGNKKISKSTSCFDFGKKLPHICDKS